MTANAVFFLLLSTYKEIKHVINDSGAQYTVILKWSDLRAEKKMFVIFQNKICLSAASMTPVRDISYIFFPSALSHSYPNL